MDTKTLNAMRTILLISVFILLGLSAFLFFKNGTLNFSTFFIAIGCLLVYAITKKRQN